MTKEEIKALVKAKIAGQGTMVDVGGALPKVIDGIVDLIPKASAGLGLSGVYTEGGNITIPEGTFAILAAGDYIINEVEENTVEEGTLRFVSHDADGLHYKTISLGSGGGDGDGLGLAYVVASSPDGTVPAIPEGAFAVFYGGPYQIELEDGDSFDLEAGQIAFISKRNSEYEVEIGTVGGGSEGPRVVQGESTILLPEGDISRVSVSAEEEVSIGDVVRFGYNTQEEAEEEEQTYPYSASVLVTSEGEGGTTGFMTTPDGDFFIISFVW